MFVKTRNNILLFFCTVFTVIHFGCDSSAKENTSLSKNNNFTADTAAVTALINKASSFAQTNFDSLRYFSSQALQKAEAINFKEGIARATKLEAFYQRRKGNFSEAVSLYLFAGRLFDSLQLKRERIDLQITLADVYKEMGGEKGTKDYLYKGLELARQSQTTAEKENYIPAVVSSLNIQGIILRDMWKIKMGDALMDSALACYEKALRLIEQSGEGKDQVAKLYNNISQVHNEKYKNYPKALEYLTKAVALNTERNNQSSLSHNYGNISDVYLQMGDYSKALEYAKNTLTICTKLNAPHRILNAYSQMIRVNKKLLRYDSALYYTDRFRTISDSLTNLDKTAQIADMQTKYETAQKELQITQLGESNKINKQRVWWAGGAAVLLLAVLSFLWLLYRRLQKQKTLIDEQSVRLQWMMKELHHRVKNNLQIVSSLLNLQSYRLKDTESVSALKESQLRVQAMSLIHQRLYQSDDVTLVNFKLYINDLAETLMKAYGYGPDDFDMDIRIEKEMLDVDTVLPLGLLVNEIVTNSFKYAYAGITRPLLRIHLLDKDGQLQMEIADNGPGIIVQDKESKKNGFGKSLIEALTKQLKGTYSVNAASGTAYNFIIPYTKEKAA